MDYIENVSAILAVVLGLIGAFALCFVLLALFDDVLKPIEKICIALVALSASSLSMHLFNVATFVSNTERSHILEVRCAKLGGIYTNMRCFAKDSEIKIELPKKKTK